VTTGLYYPPYSPPRAPSASALLFGSLALLMTFWLIAVASPEQMLGQLASVSASMRWLLASGNVGLVIAAGIAGSLVSVLSCGALLAKSPSTFIALWLFSLAFSEAQISALSQLSLLLRYSMMVPLIVAGAIGLLGGYRKEPIHWAALLVLALTALQLLMNPADTNAYLILPMQMAIFLGVFFGLYPLALGEAALKGLIFRLAVAGVAVTGINLLALVMVPEVFLGGRFRSWYPLPTNFSNNFVLCAVPLLWAALTTKSMAARLIFGMACLAALAMLLLAGTRNAMLISALTILQFSYFWRRRYFIYVLAGMLLLLLIGSAMQIGLGDLTPAGSRLAHIGEKETRIFVWERAWRYIADRPFTGFGLSTDLATLDRRLPSWEQFNAHNAYLGLWLRLGIFGLLLYLYIYWHALKTGLRTILRNRRGPLSSPLLVLFQCLLFNLFVAGLFEENLSSRASIHQAVWAIAVVIVIGQSKRLRLRRLWLQRARQVSARPSPELPAK
jgi:O-antigen ligase